MLRRAFAFAFACAAFWLMLALSACSSAPTSPYFIKESMS